jgi:hypothetical protein
MDVKHFFNLKKVDIVTGNHYNSGIQRKDGAMATEAVGDKRGRPPLEKAPLKSGRRLLTVYRIPSTMSTPILSGKINHQ